MSRSFAGSVWFVTDLTALALNAAHQLPVAELHGVVCGLAVCHGEALPIHDLIELVGIDALSDQAAVEQFVSASVANLQAQDLSFSLLLPEDDVALEARLEALGEWCGSFLAGLAAGLARRGAGSLEDCPGEVREIVRDFAAIAEIDASAMEGPTPAQLQPSDPDGGAPSTDAAEADFVELEEFVKVGALLIMSTLAHDADDPAD
jgi:hypothetical protein